MIVSSNIEVESEDYVEVLSEDSGGDPCRILFLAVIFQAMLDATKPEADNESAESVLERERARGWFFARVGVTATDFVTVCDLAGVEHGKVRELADKAINTEDSGFIRKKINALLSSHQ